MLTSFFFFFFSSFRRRVCKNFSISSLPLPAISPHDLSSSLREA